MISFTNKKTITWPQVYRLWQQNEAKNPAWIKHYQKKGFKSWAAWRKIYIEPLKLNKLKWQIGTLVNPLTTVPNFYGGPYKAWDKHFYSKKNKPTLQFKELAKLTAIKNNKRFKKLINNFPKKTTLIALKINKKIIIIEGMHRCTAITLIKNQKKLVKTEQCSVSTLKISLAFAEYPDILLPILGN